MIFMEMNTNLRINSFNFLSEEESESRMSYCQSGSVFPK